MDTVRLMELTFECLYATEILNAMYGVVKKACSGCQCGRLSQRDHICLSVNEQELLRVYMDDILREVNDTDVIRHWEWVVSVIPNLLPELVHNYKVELHRGDQRETTAWKSKMYRLTSEFIRLRNCM